MCSIAAIVSEDGEERNEDVQQVQALLVKVKAVADAQQDYLKQDKLATGDSGNELLSLALDGLELGRRWRSAGYSGAGAPILRRSSRRDSPDP